MPSKYLRKGPDKLKKCSERRTDSCGPETDGCCAVISCKYCLTWEGYEGTDYGTAEFNSTAWTGTVGGAEFVGYWEKTFDEYPEEVTSISNSIEMNFARVVGGTYDMGSPVDEPGRDADEDIESVTVGTNFVGTTQVTQSQYLTVMGLSPSHFIGGGRPVETVSFADAQQFCTRLSARPAEIRAGRSYRLPTEAEWEYACRANTTTAYSFGADPANLPTYGWFTDNSGAETQDVGGKAPNDFGLSDMHGNVWEWCITSRLGDGENNAPVRGGSWDSPAADCRSASRDVVPDTTKQNDIGFRVICVFDPPPPPGLCEFVVEFDGEEVYRKSCYEGQSCRDSSDSVEASIGYETGTLRWDKFEPRPLPTVVDYETGCRTHFCGDCHCTCKCLCVTITEPDGTIYKGEICDISYDDCGAPEWVGTVGYMSISLTLSRDEYTGECLLGGSLGGEDTELVLVSGCQTIAASFTLDDYTTVAVVCKECDCDAVECDVCDCEFSEPLACVQGELTSTGDPCAGPVVSGGSSSVPSGKEAWVVGEDTAISWMFNGFNLTIPCDLMPLNLVCALVRRAQSPSGPSAHIDNNIVQPCEYYFVVYDADFNVTFIGYEYELCCGRAEAIPTCQTRLSWIRFLNVSAGRGEYSFLWWSHSGTGFYPDGFQGNGVLPGECPFADGPNPCLES